VAGTTPRNTGMEGVEGGVGLTALMVAAARAIETHRHDTLARDVYAEHFVLAAPASAGWPVRIQQVPDGDANPLWGRFARYFGLRTRVLDDFLLRSVRTGSARQVVLLGAGLDSRAFRLDWPPGCVIFEIDREGVLAFDGGRGKVQVCGQPSPG
jgi:methyltransferase (TIGR00027 family)